MAFYQKETRYKQSSFFDNPDWEKSKMTLHNSSFAGMKREFSSGHPFLDAWLVSRYNSCKEHMAGDQCSGRLLKYIHPNLVARMKCPIRKID